MHLNNNIIQSKSIHNKIAYITDQYAKKINIKILIRKKDSNPNWGKICGHPVLYFLKT